MITRIFKVSVEYQEMRNGELINDDYYEMVKNFIANDAKGAIDLAILEAEKPYNLTNEAEEVKAYLRVNCKVMNVEFIAAAGD